MKKVFIKTLGCEKNTVDSEVAAGLFVKKGLEITDDFYEADFILINTCAFINDAKKQSIDTIIEYGEEKAADQKLIVSGCLSQRYLKELEKALPEVDLFVGVNDYDKLAEMLVSGDFVSSCSKEDAAYCELGERLVLDRPYSASIKIAEGCNNVCTYCVIPYIRGRFRSRKPENILKEASMLAEGGCRELIVIAQDTTAYGSDLDDGSTLPALLKELCKIEGFKWIRLMYCYEDEITDELIDVISAEPKICKYLDIPLQHYSDDVLRAMNRRSTSESISRSIDKLRSRIPDIVIRTTFITGFPGETKEDFDKLYDYVEKTRFDRLGVFAYSKEEGTIAAKMKDQVRKDVKERRRDKIMALQQHISLENNQKYIGRTMDVLVEEDYGDGSFSGRTEFDAPDIDNAVLFTSDKALVPGDFVKVYINDAFDYDLSGKAL